MSASSLLGKTAAQLRQEGIRLGEYGVRGGLRDRLVQLIVSGEKTATASLAAEYLAEGSPEPRVGDVEAILDERDIAVAVTRNVRVDRVRLDDVTWDFAQAEGEGFVSLADWRTQHEHFWRTHVVPALPGFTLDGDAIVICVWLEVLAR
ncbi:MAG: ASCH domain-containing protein [Deltaproteobacteria bacterium]|nr:ASCH domain-containing protein [Deltaproteobacteria bacterium]